MSDRDAILAYCAWIDARYGNLRFNVIDHEQAVDAFLAARPAPERAEPAGSDEVRPCDACMVPCEERGPILPSCPPVLAPIIAPDSCDECQVPQDARHPCPPCSTPSPPHIPGVCDADLHPLCPLCGARVTSTFGCLTCKGLPSGFGPFIPHEHDPPLAAPLPAREAGREWWRVVSDIASLKGPLYHAAYACDANGVGGRRIGDWHEGDDSLAAARADGAASGIPEWRGTP